MLKDVVFRCKDKPLNGKVAPCVLVCEGRRELPERCPFRHKDKITWEIIHGELE